MDDHTILSDEELAEAVAEAHDQPINDAPWQIDAFSPHGDWTCVRTRADPTGLALELEHPTGERMLASTFSPDELLDMGRLDCMFWRTTADWPAGQRTVETVDPDDPAEIEEYTTGYDPIRTAVTAMTTARDFASHHDRELGWIDLEWVDAVEYDPSHPVDEITAYFDEYFQDVSREQLERQFEYYAD